MREVRLKYTAKLNINSRTNWRPPFSAHLFTKCTSKYFLVSTTKYGFGKHANNNLQSYSRFFVNRRSRNYTFFLGGGVINF